MDDTLLEQTRSGFQETFHRPPQAIAYAPGRIEIIGNHTDYNEGDVLGAAIGRRIYAASALNEGEKLAICSTQSGVLVEIDLSRELKPLEGPHSWVNYPLGVLRELLPLYPELRHGVSLYCHSDLPIGGGLSSSAAIELSSALAFLALEGASMDRVELARLCRRAENDFVGVPSGILDQGVSVFGQEQGLVRIDCETEVFNVFRLETEVAIWIFDSGEQHSLADGSYERRFQECRQALSEIQKVFPNTACLARLTPDALAWVREQGDAVWAKRARHVAEEHLRVDEAVQRIEAGDLPGLGKLLQASHWSSSRLFENSTERLDWLVEGLSVIDGVHGCRLTGGGFGGGAMALADPSLTPESFAPLLERFAAQFETRPQPLRLKIGAGADLANPL